MLDTTAKTTTRLATSTYVCIVDGTRETKAIQVLPQREEAQRRDNEASVHTRFAWDDLGDSAFGRFQKLVR